MSTVRMKKLELAVLISDLDSVIRCLADSGSFELIPASADELEPQQSNSKRGEAGQSETANKHTPEEALASIARSAAILGVETGEGWSADTHRATVDDCMTAASLEQRCQALQSRLQEAAKNLEELQLSLREARMFAGLNMPFERLNELSFLSVRMGRIDINRLEQLKQEIQGRALLVVEPSGDTILAVAPRRARFLVDTALSSAGFIPVQLKSDFRGIPDQVIQGLAQAMEEAQAALTDIQKEKAALAQELGPILSSLAASFRLDRALTAIEARIRRTNWTARIEGWVPANREAALIAELRARTSSRILVRSSDPEPARGAKAEQAGEAVERASIPVLLQQGRLASSFSSLVLSYGVPVYGSIDPTPFVAFFFVLLFSIMFGDVGQGALILLAGLLLRNTRSPKLQHFMKFSPALLACGAGSIVFGLLDGTMFANEELLIPWSRAVTQAVWGVPRDRILQIMPQESIGAMFRFFAFTLGVGFCINLVGIIINIVNQWRMGLWEEAVFAKTGLAGGALLVWSAGIAVRVGSGGRLGWIDLPGIGIPLAAILVAEPIREMVKERRGGHHVHVSAIDIIVGGLVELIETIAYHLSNSMSFLRVGAFALSHAVLSFVVFTMAGLVRGSGAGSLLGRAVIYVIGNAVILMLEGLIVVIQAIRLQYYEFFSKFFTSSGRPFRPLRLE